MIEQMELAPLKELVAGYTQLANWQKVRTYGELAMYIQPADLETQMALARAYLELGEPAKALFADDSALVIKPAAAAAGAAPSRSRQGLPGDGQDRGREGRDREGEGDGTRKCRGDPARGALPAKYRCLGSP